MFCADAVVVKIRAKRLVASKHNSKMKSMFLSTLKREWAVFWHGRDGITNTRTDIYRREKHWQGWATVDPWRDRVMHTTPTYGRCESADNQAKLAFIGVARLWQRTRGFARKRRYRIHYRISFVDSILLGIILLWQVPLTMNIFHIKSPKQLGTGLQQSTDNENVVLAKKDNYIAHD